MRRANLCHLLLSIACTVATDTATKTQRQLDHLNVHAAKLRTAKIEDKHYGEREIAYRISDGIAIVDGDIHFGTESDFEAARVDTPTLKDPVQPEKRSWSLFSLDVWPNATILYTYPNLTTDIAVHELLNSAIAAWTERAPYLQFIKTPYTPQPLNGILFVTGLECDGCWGYSGYDANAIMRLHITVRSERCHGGCLDRGATHELGHVLGACPNPSLFMPNSI